MNDKNFKKMDEEWMKKMSPIRDKEVSEGILKGFSASVERRLVPEELTSAKRRSVFARAWAPAMAIMVLASLVVLRSPITNQGNSADTAQGSEYDIQDEIEMLKEIGAWGETEDETVLGADALEDTASGS